jgi:hypothetical protein
MDMRTQEEIHALEQELALGGGPFMPADVAMIRSRVPYGPNTLRIRTILMQSTPLRSQVANLAGCAEQELARALVGESDLDDLSWTLIEAYLRRISGSPGLLQSGLRSHRL